LLPYFIYLTILVIFWQPYLLLQGIFSHRGIGQIHFSRNEPDSFTGFRIRGTTFYAAPVFLGAIFLQQYVNDSFTISYIEFDFNKTVELKLEFPISNSNLFFVLKGNAVLGAGTGYAEHLQAGQYIYTTETPDALKLFEGQKAVVLLISSYDNRAWDGLNHAQNFNCVQPIPPSIQLLLEEFFSNEYNDILRGLYYEKIIADAFFYHFLAVEQAVSDDKYTGIPEPIKAVHDLILAAGMDTKFTLTELAERIGLSESSLKKGYKKHYGISPFDQQVYMRLEWARQQLETTVLPINQLYRQAGYAHLPGFLKAFKKCYGLSPSQWRKQHKQ